MVIKRHQTRILGYLGECYAKLEMAKKSFFVSGVDHGFHFDMLCENGLKIDVKASLPSINKKLYRGKWYTYKNWQFRLTNPKQMEVNDFIVCVVFSKIEDPPLGYFIFPIEHIRKFRKSRNITVFESDIKGEFKKSSKKDIFQYFNNWDLIIKSKQR